MTKNRQPSEPGQPSQPSQPSKPSQGQRVCAQTRRQNTSSSLFGSMEQPRLNIHMLPTLDDEVVLGIFHTRYHLWYGVSQCPNCENIEGFAEWIRKASQPFFDPYCFECSSKCDIVELEYFQRVDLVEGPPGAAPSTPPLRPTVAPASTPPDRRIARPDVLMPSDKIVAHLPVYNIAFAIHGGFDDV